MNKWKILLGGCLLASTALMAGCDGDDAVDNPKDAGTSSGGNDGSVVNPDGGSPDGSTTCNFASFVTNLIKTQTTATSTPSTDLGQSCIDNKDPKEFAPLFP